ncbi:MAG: hypothetical protein AAB922_02305 [Patescibacteria group bacterium]
MKVRLFRSPLWDSSIHEYQNPMDLTKVNPIDWSLTPVDPDPNFDPEHNRRVIDEVVRKNRLVAKRKERESQEGTKERVNAITTYLKSLSSGRTKSDVVRYFGKQEIARLRGTEILNRLKYTDLGEEMKNKLKSIGIKYS